MADATILVVDDEPQIRRVLQTSLSSSGYDVILAKDGQEAIEMVMRERRPEMWVATTNFPTAASHPFCTRLNQRLAEHYFVEGQCQPFYAEIMGRPSRQACTSGWKHH